ncbi:hypothetical protein AKO1_008946 [Acrasis kona]|uniref:Uncharacterized protein n=1 Tax=Acrasis kona TaxID=1008807 RepID=A0AAW2ZHE5_9EUKA
MFATLAHFYKRFDVPTIASRCYDISKNLLATIYDQVLTDKYVVNANLYSGMYHSLEGEVDKARFYFTTVDAYLKYTSNETHSMYETAFERTTRTLRRRCLFLTHHCYGCLMSEEVDMKRLVKLLLGLYFLVKYYEKYLAARENKKQPIVGDIDEFIPCLDMILSDIENGTDGFRLDIEMIDILSKKIRHTFDTYPAKGEELDNSLKRLSFLMVAQGLKIQLLIASGSNTTSVFEGDDPIILQLANLIITLTSVGIFNLASAFCILPVCIAISVHIDMLSKAPPAKKIDIVHHLKLGIKGLMTLGSRFELVFVRYRTLVRDAENAVRMYEEQLSRSMSFTHNQNDVSPVSPVAVNVKNTIASLLIGTTPSSHNNFKYSGDRDLSNMDFDRFLGEFLNDGS